MNKDHKNKVNDNIACQFVTPLNLELLTPSVTQGDVGNSG